LIHPLRKHPSFLHSPLYLSSFLFSEHLADLPSPFPPPLSTYPPFLISSQVATDLSHIPTPALTSGFLPNTGSQGAKGPDEQGKGAENALKGADIVVIPAGVPRKPGMT